MTTISNDANVWRGSCKGCWLFNLTDGMDDVALDGCQHVMILRRLVTETENVAGVTSALSLREFAAHVFSDNGMGTVARVDRQPSSERRTYVVTMSALELQNYAAVSTPDTYAVCDLYVRKYGHVLASCRMCCRGKLRADRRGVTRNGRILSSHGDTRRLICVHVWKILSSGVGASLGAGWTGESYYEVLNPTLRNENCLPDSDNSSVGGQSVTDYNSEMSVDHQSECHCAIAPCADSQPLFRCSGADWCSELSDPSDVEDSNPSGTVGVQWSISTGRWIPDETCSPGPIPESMSSECTYWARRRDTLSDVQVDPLSGKWLRVSQGFWSMKDAVPTFCRSCDSPLSDSLPTKHVRDMTLHTRSGPCARRVFAAKCELCSEWVEWDPESECIHSVRKGQIGGVFRVVMYITIPHAIESATCVQPGTSWCTT